MSGLFSIDSPERLYEKVKQDFVAFYKDPTIDGLFQVLFPLYHLREWICPGGYRTYKGKAVSARNAGEVLYSHLESLPEYSTLRSLCNHAKHLSDPGLNARTEVLEGFRVGLGGCGDSLGVTHFVVENRDVRDVLSPVFRAYRNYFEGELPTGS